MSLTQQDPDSSSLGRSRVGRSTEDGKTASAEFADIHGREINGLVRMRCSIIGRIQLLVRPG